MSRDLFLCLPNNKKVTRNKKAITQTDIQSPEASQTHSSSHSRWTSDSLLWSAVRCICWLIGRRVPLWTLQLIKAAVSILAAHSFGGWPAGSETPADIPCAATASITSLTSRLMSLRWPVWLRAHGWMAALSINVIEAWPHSYDVKELYDCRVPHDLTSSELCFYTLWMGSVLSNKNKTKMLPMLILLWLSKTEFPKVWTSSCRDSIYILFGVCIDQYVYTLVSSLQPFTLFLVID